MKGGAALIIVLGVAAIGAGAYYAYSANRYGEAVDARMERELSEAELSIIRAQIEGKADAAMLLSRMYRGPMNEELNQRFARLVAGWTQAYPRLARIPIVPDQRTDMQLLAVEVDERLGAGSFAVMQAEYDHFRTVIAPRLAEERARERELNERVGLYIQEYMLEHGEYPPGTPVTR